MKKAPTKGPNIDARN